MGMAGFDTSTEVHGLYGRDGEHKDAIGEVEDLPCDDQGPQRETEKGEYRGGDGTRESPTKRSWGPGAIWQ